MRKIFFVKMNTFLKDKPGAGMINSLENFYHLEFFYLIFQMALMRRDRRIQGQITKAFRRSENQLLKALRKRKNEVQVS